MTYSIQKLNDNFPIYLIRNFEIINDSLKSELIDIILECKSRNHFSSGGSFLVDRDYQNFFSNLYRKFERSSFDLFKMYTKSNRESLIWSYSSNKYNHGTIPGQIHNHINTSTINSVYYLSIPNSVTEEKGSITFFLRDMEFTYTPKNYDLLIFPNYLDHRINNYEDDEEWRISINMEIKCEESSEELFSRVTT